MPEPERGTCKLCGRAMLWVRTPAHQLLSVDAEPSPDGTVVLAADGSAYVLRGDLFETRPPGSRHHPHFATCPGAQHRRSRQ